MLAPTRELANQVAREFETAASSLKLVCCYGGVPVMGQKRKLHDGVDVVCGTPGRIIDLIQQRAMNLSKVRIIPYHLVVYISGSPSHSHFQLFFN